MYMNEQDWAEFNHRFPSARSFIDARELQREHEVLTAEKLRLLEFRRKWFERLPMSTEFPDQKRLTWVEQRVAFLDEHFSSRVA